MAPRKEAIDEKSKKNSAAKKTENRVVKRPARGYHKFKNGMLNVTPKGGEKELVKNNQNSPLLRLAPEIRNRIWTFVLGGMLFRPLFSGRSYKKMRPSNIDRNDGLTLLRTCRQIYHETALLPFRSNFFIFSAVSLWGSKLNMFRMLRGYQLQQITSIKLEIDSFTGVNLHTLQLVFDGCSRRSHASMSQALPGLKHIHICVFNPPGLSESVLEDYKNRRLEQIKQIKQFFSGRNLDISVEMVIGGPLGDTGEHGFS
ncbi:hypothetical protein P153DRAFT_354172 [Dothidotthia symphoricarpi CBS 119687]|uniref:Uncharacterized protein n=1 Tax=Dothidotthia symphoricarpi CBS 119687 TaxID=1392245 RepID=A0A6A6AMA3_9PLEO|nr:uncharacterized protein P153DRAFT_354172 [Dothidotthia symphoricarpi CBS 119687]KAF2132696.1 hypothetical protein P153DRAFT_354172 [Dothidotthia symphoricarpi CBS 119687]